MVKITEEPNPSFKHTVKFNLNDSSEGSISIDGNEIDMAIGIEINAIAGEIPVAIVSVVANKIVYEGEAAVFIEIGEKRYGLVEIE